MPTPATSTKTMGGAVTKKLFLLPVAAAAFIALTAGKCSDPSAEAQRQAWCAVNRPVCWSTRDTPATKRDAKRHNAVGKALCDWTPNRNPCSKE